MKALIVLAALSLSLPAVAVNKPAPKKAPAGLACPAPDRFPFPVPSADDTEGWGDDDFESWAVAAWADYCRGRESTHECRCAALHGGGVY